MSAGRSWGELRSWTSKARSDELFQDSALFDRISEALGGKITGKAATEDSPHVTRTATADQLDFLASTFKRLAKLYTSDKGSTVSLLERLFGRIQLESPGGTKVDSQAPQAEDLSRVLFAAYQSPFKPVTSKGTDLLASLVQLLNVLRMESGNLSLLSKILSPIITTACISLNSQLPSSSRTLPNFGNPLAKSDLAILAKILKSCPPINQSGVYLPIMLLDNLLACLSMPKERDLAGQRGKVVLELFMVEGYLEKAAANGDGGHGSKWEARVASEQEPVGNEEVAKRKRDLVVAKLLEWVHPASFAAKTLPDLLNTSEVEHGKDVKFKFRYDLETLLDGLGKYVLPTLFLEDPLIGSELLDRLSAPAYEIAVGSLASSPSSTMDAYATIPSWIQILSVYLLNTPTSATPLAIPKETFLIACHHKSHPVRLAAWKCLVECREEKRKVGDGLDFVDKNARGVEEGPAGNESVQEKVYWEILEGWIKGNMNVWSSDFRSAYLSSFNTFIKRLSWTHPLSTRLGRPTPYDDPENAVHADHLSRNQRYQAHVNNLLSQILANLILPILRWPLKSNYAKMVTAMEMLRSLMEYDRGAAKGSRSNVEQLSGIRITFSEEGGNPSGETGYKGASTAKTVDALLACFASNYREIRDKAAELIDQVPLVFGNSDKAESLMAEAFERLDGARNTDAETAALIIRAVYKRGFVRLDAVQAPRPAMRDADHGPSKKDFEPQQARDLGVMLRLLDKLDSNMIACEADLVVGMTNAPLHGLLLAIAKIVECLDQRGPISRTVLQQLFGRMISMIQRTWAIARQILVFADRADAPDHESVRVNAMLDTDGDDDPMGGEETSEELLIVLSNSWRCMKEASNLLASLHHNGHFLWVIDAEENSVTGRLFLEWMNEIRHRGTFSSVAASFESFLGVLRRSAAGKTLQQDWLQSTIAGIQQDHRSTTRRSAALPYCVLALIQGGEQYFSIALQALLQQVIDAGTEVDVKVHSMNILRVLLSDARQTTYLATCFEDCMRASLNEYKSVDWGVRNAALHLFSTLVVRVLGRDINKPFQELSQTTMLETVVAKYPNLMGMWLEALRSAGGAETVSFLVILALKVLRTSTDSPIAQDFRRLLVPILSSPDAKLRMAAAEAISAMTPAGMGMQVAMELLMLAATSPDANSVHGHLLAVLAFAPSWRAVGEEARQILADKLKLVSGNGSVHNPVCESLVRRLQGDLASRVVVPEASGPSAQADNWNLAAGATGNSHAISYALNAVSAGSRHVSGQRSVDSWDRVHVEFETCTIVPLRETMLPALGSFAPFEDHDRVARTLEHAKLAADVEASAESRQSAVLCLRTLAPGVLNSEDTSLGTRPSAFDLTWTLLQDDDQDVRGVASGIVGTAFADGAPISQARAAQIWLDRAGEMNDEEAVIWENMLWDRLDLQNRLDCIQADSQGTSDLFASEPSNIFLEEQVDFGLVYDAYLRNLQAIPEEQKSTLFARRRGALLQYNNLKSHTGKISPIEPRREDQMMRGRILDAIRGLKNAMDAEMS